MPIRESRYEHLVAHSPLMKKSKCSHECRLALALVVGCAPHTIIIPKAETVIFMCKNDNPVHSYPISIDR